MSYDPEKYRKKREKVLGIKKKGLGFGTLAMLVSLVIVTVLSIVTIPQAISYMATRHLDDAIFKLESNPAWPKSIITGINAMDGVKTIADDTHNTRLVVTYDRRMVKLSNITALFEQQNLNVTLLNQVNHRQHQNTLKKEEKDLATP
ncbi:hypothetical protein [Desulfobacula toluolica]|uniref:Uncharacterized protein n=1 Tax=Desulfobacula toluolica (strain DSM 7467 / Tol2) TaxID=651182 RepID=K0NNC1_DESTT|nr:hypothetical protein [Desulfobacula toluolica]CCK82125.1 uncharacterized protein TOL2_C39700 [Desulfobacula toluolica Tol2]